MSNGLNSGTCLLILLRVGVILFLALVAGGAAWLVIWAVEYLC